MVLTSIPTSVYDFGSIGLFFIIIMTLLKLLGSKKNGIPDSLVKKIEDVETRITEIKVVLNDSSERVKLIQHFVQELREIHCGASAKGVDGIPRWYVSEELQVRIKVLHDLLSSFVHYTEVLERYCKDCDLNKCIIYHWVISTKRITGQLDPEFNERIKKIQESHNVIPENSKEEDISG